LLAKGFFLESSSKDEKKFLEVMFKEDIAGVLWQYLPESKFKDRARSFQFGEEYQLEGKNMFKPFKVKASSKYDVVVSKMDLKAVVYSNCDAASASIVLSDLNGRYVSPQKWPFHPRKKIQTHWDSDHLYPTINRKWSSSEISDQGDFKKLEYSPADTCSKRLSFSRNTKRSSRSSQYLTVNRAKSNSRNPSTNYLTVTRKMNAPDKNTPLVGLRILKKLTSSSSKSWSIPETDPTTLEEKTISPGGGMGSGEAVVAIPIPSNHTLAANLTPEKLLRLIDEFETRVKDALLTEISSEYNQCRWVADAGANEQKSLIEKVEDIYRVRRKRAEQKAEDEFRRMAILLRPETEFYQNMTNTELDHVAEDQEYSADPNIENRGSVIKKTGSSVTAELRCFSEMLNLPYIENTFSEELDHHLDSRTIN